MGIHGCSRCPQDSQGTYFCLSRDSGERYISLRGVRTITRATTRSAPLQCGYSPLSIAHYHGLLADDTFSNYRQPDYTIWQLLIGRFLAGRVLPRTEAGFGKRKDKARCKASEADNVDITNPGTFTAPVFIARLQKHQLTLRDDLAAGPYGPASSPP